MIWRPIPGHPIYMVSDTGLICSHARRFACILKPHRAPSGHLRVMLGRGVHMMMHQAVLLAFVGPCPEGHESRHLNGIPDDNRWENLVWDTRSQNTRDDKWHGKIRQKLTVEAVRDIKANARPAMHSYSGDGNYEVFMEKYGVNRSTISAIVMGRLHSDVSV